VLGVGPAVGAEHIRTQLAGRVIYRLVGGAAAQAAAPVVRVMSLRGFSRAGLAAAMVALGTARAARLRAAGPTEATQAVDPMAAWMAAQAAGGEKKDRHPALAALCCVVSPVQEFLEVKPQRWPSIHSQGGPKV
jgi:hypothetical protein